jgi:hypothetical protein
MKKSDYSMGHRHWNIRAFYFLLLSVVLSSCAGTISTVRHTTETPQYKKAYVVSAENSNYIKFKFGAITPFGYIVLPDDPSQKHEVIGNTDVVIKQELEKYGIHSVVGKKDDIPSDFDLIVLYADTWRWDMKKILDKLEIVFISREGDKELARSTYNIYKNKEIHNFPSPEKEVPQMVKELLGR